MKKQAWLTMAVLLCCVGCTPKESKEKEHKDKPVVQDNSVAEDFRRLDADNDGSLIKDEAEKNGTPALQANFDKFDANKDGKLSLQEVTAFVLAQHEEDTRRKNEAFRRIDANHDGGISKEEAEKEKDPFLIMNFDAIDADKDGKMSLQELNTFTAAPPEKTAQPEQPAQQPQPAQPRSHAQTVKPGPLFIAADKDHNGTLSKDELKDKPELYQNFDNIDADHDGKVTTNEIVSYVNAHPSLAQGQEKTVK